MEEKKIYPKVVLTDKQLAVGNLKDYDQFWDIIYYEQMEAMIDKIVLRTYEEPKAATENPKKYALRSIYFRYPEQLKIMIRELINAYLYFMVIRNKPVIPVIEYQKILLNCLVNDLRTEQLKKWSKAHL